jgi:UDP-2-acetamido-3-amino-2,3-dideoxy-glucuronate N-acetyltransferase
VYVDIEAEIGNNVKIQNFVSVYKGVKIEDDVFVGPAVTFTNDLYPRSFSWDYEHVVPTRVGRGASIGANSTIVCGINIGEYAMVGAGSIVTRDVPPNALVLGNAAEIAGWVCECGKRLLDISKENAEEIIFKCSSCGKSIGVEKNWLKK